MGCRKLTYSESLRILKVVSNNLKISVKSYAGDYRYGFQGQETDDEVKGEGNSVNYKYRMHDPRIGRFFAVDPLAPKYPHYTPYQFSGNEVISMVELEGLEPGESGACSSGGCVAVPRPDKDFEAVQEQGLVFVPEDTRDSWYSADGKTLNSFRDGEHVFDFDSEKNWYYTINGVSYNEGSYSDGTSGSFNPTLKGADKSFDYFKYTIENPAGAMRDWWKHTDMKKDGYWTGYWDLTSYQKGVTDGGFFQGVVESLPTMVMSGGTFKGAGMLGKAYGLSNRTLATSYLFKTNQLQNFASVDGFSFSLGLKQRFVYHNSMGGASNSRWFTSTNYSNSGAAFNGLGLDYLGTRNFAQNKFGSRNFGFSVRGTAAPQGTSLGGGTQYFRTGLSLGTNYIPLGFFKFIL